MSVSRRLINPDNSILQGEDSNDSILQGENRQKSKAPAPGTARLEPPGMGLWRLYDLPVFTATGTFSLTLRARINRALLQEIISASRY
ncbi:Yersinia protein of uncharacterised function (DUF3831) [Yersinia enterocolitica]|nr:Yersinia protein of uncharacterised function (DUF3831) [Yersinia enterocolitica]